MPHKSNGLQVLKCALLLFAGISMLALAVAVNPAEVGFENLFVTNNETWVPTCQAATFPSYINGSFIIPTTGQFEMGSMKLEGLLDGYGKFHRFTLANGQVCFSCRMMDTEFYNNSIRLGKVAPSILFDKTSPPRNITGMGNMLGPNDNVFVNTYEMAGMYRSVTDSPQTLQFDPFSLRMVANVTWKDNLMAWGLGLGSAHPLKHGNGCVYDVMPWQDYTTLLSKKVKLFKICEDAPFTRVEVNEYSTKYMGYFHSWGMSANYAIFPLQHFSIGMMGVASGKALSALFNDEDMSNNFTSITLLPLDGSKVNMTFNIPGHVYYTHHINSYETADAVVFDFCSFAENPFLKESSLSVYLNPAQRNAIPESGKAVAQRVTLYTSGAKAGQAEVTDLSPPGVMVDFPNIHHDFFGKKYCFFYAVEWFHDLKHYSSMAVVKHNVCTGERTFWYQAGMYPSEPTFVENPNNNAEDSGTLMFTVLDGAAAKSHYVVVDASDMSTISQTELPTFMGFTTHGQFYPNLV